MLLDSHNHFWQYDKAAYDWITPEMAVIAKDFLPEDLQPIQEKAGFDGTIAVQARQTLEETRWLLELATENPRIKGVVGWVDLRSDNLEDQLKQFAAHPKLVGVRHIVQAEPDDRFMLREDFLAGIAKLKAYNLTYDILTFPRQLPAALELVKMFPDQPFVIDHISKPLIKDRVVEPWETDMRTFANHAHVMCKLSGMVTEADWENWKPEDMTPYLDTVMDVFGPDRLMIGSDWPVCLVAGSYGEVMNIVKTFISDMSAEEQQKILGGNCGRFYGITK